MQTVPSQHLAVSWVNLFNVSSHAYRAFTQADSLRDSFIALFPCFGQISLSLWMCSGTVHRPWAPHGARLRKTKLQHHPDEMQLSTCDSLHKLVQFSRDDRWSAFLFCLNLHWPSPLMRPIMTQHCQKSWTYTTHAALLN